MDRGNSTPPGVNFPGFARPSTDFAAVRDGRRSPILFALFDLSVARSIAAGTAGRVDFAGNSFYLDQAPDVGPATVHFQDVGLSPANVGIYCIPGTIIKAPWTQLLIENAAQPGKVLRICYGVDVDFVPGMSPQIAISGTVSVQEQGGAYGASYQASLSPGANTATVAVAAGANVNGLRIYSRGVAINPATASQVALLAKAGAAPANIADGEMLMVGAQLSIAGQSAQNYGLIQRVGATKGLYFFNNAANNGQVNFLNYDAL